jgi:ankyrin repeat protein
LLHRAAETGRLEMVEALLKVPGIDIHAKDKDKWGGTPLHKDFFIYLQG